MLVQIHKRVVLSFPELYNSKSFSTAASPSSDLVSAVVSLLTHHRSKSRWSHLRSLLSPANTLTPADFNQIALQLKSKPHLALRFFLFTVGNSLFTHNLHSYSTTIHILCRGRLKSKAQYVVQMALRSQVLYHDNPSLKLFETLVKTYRDCDSAPYVFDLLIKSCLELKKIHESMEIVRMLLSRGISPQIHTCNLLITAVSRCMGSHASYGVFREVFGLEDCEIESNVKRIIRVKPNVHSFNALMVGFYRDGDMEMLEEIWNEMEKLGCTANGYSYSVLMAVLCEAGRMREAEKAWEEMAVKGIKPDIVAYNTLIGGFCKIGKIEKAEEYFRKMEIGGIENSCVTFEHLVNGYCKAGDVDSAMLVYKDMCRKDFAAEASTMNVLIGGLCEKKRVFEALEIMRVAMKDGSFYPSRKSFELLIKGLCEDGKMNEALKLQAEMVGIGFEPNSIIYDAFIEGYVKMGNEEMAAKLRKEMPESLRMAQEED